MSKKYIRTFTILFAVLALSSLLFISCSGSNTGTTEGMEEDMTSDTAGYMDVSPEEAKKLIEDNPDLIIIDVSPSYDNGHLPGAVNYYVGDGSLDEAIPGLDPDSKYLVYCHVDSAAIAGAQKLVDAGFKNVYRLEGNYSAWVDAGYPIEK
jgi:adenylyltransferase/sulfurtransferase